MAIVLNNITSGYNLAKINANFQNIEDYINDKLLARADTGVAGEAMMERALDMNGNKILNVFVDVNDPDSLLTLSVADSRYYNVSGDTLTGPMNANSQIINNLPTPVQPSQPATKDYTDSGDLALQLQINKTLRVPESSVDYIPTVLGRQGKLFAWNDVGNPIAVLADTDDGTQLEINLAGTDGLKYIGRCSDLTALRLKEPSKNNQHIYVESYSPGWTAQVGVPVGGGEFYYDQNDTTSADDDLFVFVTAGGKRWKRICDGSEIYLSWKGVKSGDNATPALNAIGNYLKAKAIAAGTVANLPICVIPKGVYTLSDTVTLHHAFRIKSIGYVEFTTPGWDGTVSKDIFTIANSIDIPAVPDKGYANRTPWINGVDGTIVITGPSYNSAITNNINGVGVGNLVTGAAPIRGNVMHGVSIRQCGNAVYMRMRRLYLTSFTQCQFELNNTHLTFPNISNSEDSGERISFDECVFGGCRNQHVYSYMAPAVHFNACSFDFSQGSGVYLDGISEYGLFSFTNCHFENFNSYLVNSQTGARVRIIVTNCDVFNNSQTTPVTPSSASSPSRPMFYLLNGGNLIINGFSLNYTYRPLGHENILALAGSSTPSARLRVAANGLTSGDRSLTPAPSFSAISNRSYDMSLEVIGNTITNKTTFTTTQIQPAQEITSAWSSGVSAAIISGTSGGKALQLTSTDTAQFAFLESTKPIPVIPGRAYASYFSLQKLVSTGNMNWGVSFFWYDKDGNLLLQDTALTGQMLSVYDDTTLPGYSSDPTVNGNRMLSTLTAVRVAPAGAFYARPYLSISTFSGQINIVNFLMWEFL